MCPKPSEVPRHDAYAVGFLHSGGLFSWFPSTIASAALFGVLVMFISSALLGPACPLTVVLLLLFFFFVIFRSGWRSFSRTIRFLCVAPVGLADLLALSPWSEVGGSRVSARVPNYSASLSSSLSERGAQVISSFEMPSAAGSFPVSSSVRSCLRPLGRRSAEFGVRPTESS